MSLRDSIQIALLLAVGYVLRLIVPGYAAGMKPDPMMGMLIVIILLHRNVRVALLAGLITGLIGALTTTFPGGQLPYLMDKIVTSFFILLLCYLVANPLEKLLGKATYQFLGFKASLGTFISCGILGSLGTLFSGTAFLTLALAIVGLPAPFKILFATVVIPAAIGNTLVVMILYPLVTVTKRLMFRSTAAEAANEA